MPSPRDLRRAWERSRKHQGTVRADSRSVRFAASDPTLRSVRDEDQAGPQVEGEDAGRLSGVITTNGSEVEMRLARTRLVLINLDLRDHRRSSRLLLDFLDARTEYTAGRLEASELMTVLDTIEAEAAA